MLFKRCFLLVVGLGIFTSLITGCVDIPSTAPTPPELLADFRFVNGNAAIGEVDLSVDDVAIGSVGFGQVIPHKEFLAGSRTTSLSNGDEINVTMPTERRGTVVILGIDVGVRDFIRLDERQRFIEANIGDVAITLAVDDGSGHEVDSTVTVAGGKLRVVNLHSAETIDVTIEGVSPLIGTVSDSRTLEGLAYKGNSGYQQLANGDYTVTVKAAGTDSVISATTVTVASMRQTSILLEKADGSGTLLNLNDN